MAGCLVGWFGSFYRVLLLYAERIKPLGILLCSCERECYCSGPLRNCVLESGMLSSGTGEEQYVKGVLNHCLPDNLSSCQLLMGR